MIGDSLPEYRKSSGPQASLELIVGTALQPSWNLRGMYHAGHSATGMVRDG